LAPWATFFGTAITGPEDLKIFAGGYLVLVMAG
jgi:hypothetical protein